MMIPYSYLVLKMGSLTCGILSGEYGLFLVSAELMNSVLRYTCRCNISCGQQLEGLVPRTAAM